MKSTTTARMPETTLIRVTLSISSPCYWHVPNSEQDVNRGSRTVTREILHRFALASYCAAEIFQVSCLGSSILEIALFGTGADNLWSLLRSPAMNLRVKAQEEV